MDNISSIQDFRHTVALRDGSSIIVRPIFPADKTNFLTMFNCLSKETKFLRYHYVKLHLSDNEVETYCNIDYSARFVLIAEKSYPDLNRIVGVGRFDRIGESATAEISFIVDDIEQGKGICTILLDDLKHIAFRFGIDKFIGLLTNENVIMMSILKKTAPDLEIEVDEGDILISFNIK
jgi:hypothetical protein